MTQNFVFALCATILAAMPARAETDVAWRLVMANDSRVVLPQLLPPSEVINYDHVAMADSGAGLLGFTASMTASSLNLWAQRGNGLVPYAEVGAGGATGPGRSGGESGHTFTRLAPIFDSIGTGARVFSGYAGASAASASEGMWQWNGVRNVEFVRVFTDGPLGPGMGPDWRYTALNNVGFEPIVIALPHRRALFPGRVARPDQADNSGDDSWSMYTPGAGNRPCLLQDSTAPDFAPGVAGTTFSDVSRRVGVSRRGEIYAAATLFDTHNYYIGIWQFCDGAPRVVALEGASGELGPGLADSTVTFYDVEDYLSPSVAGGFYFSARTGTSPNVTRGVFHHHGNRNEPILQEGVTGAAGPQIAGHIFQTPHYPHDLKAAGPYAALKSSISPASDTSQRIGGLWRLTPDQGIQPVAIEGDSGSYAPPNGGVWYDFHQFAVFDNGDIVAAISVDTSSNISLWRFRIGQPPVEILKVGDVVAVPTTSGTVNASITGISVPGSFEYVPGGYDDWSSANGEIIVRVGLQGFNGNTYYVRGVAARPDYLFADDFD